MKGKSIMDIINNIIETIKKFMQEEPTIFYAIVGVIVFAIILIIALSSKKGKKKNFEPVAEEAKIESQPKEEKSIINTSGVSIFEAINNQTNAPKPQVNNQKVQPHNPGMNQKQQNANTVKAPTPAPTPQAPKEVVAQDSTKVPQPPVVNSTPGLDVPNGIALSDVKDSK